MVVNLFKKSAEQLHTIDGIQIYVGQANIKKSHHDDLTVFILSPSTTVAGVFTQNKFCAAPVLITKEHLEKNNAIKALLINTGIANAGTGLQGKKNALEVCHALANQLECNIEQILPFSTGVIMEPLPTKKIIPALKQIKATSWADAAKAIMTTDTVPKSASKSITINNEKVFVTGIAKGSGMIHPNMATMLSFIATDAPIQQNILNSIIKEIADNSFNLITVDGDTSTNDSFILLATGKSHIEPILDDTSEGYEILKEAIQEVALELAKSIVRDGEGASKFITIKINGADSIEDAKKVAYSIAHSPLVKTAFYASDANLGRILSAIGNAKINTLDVSKIDLFLDNILVIEQGALAELYTNEDGQRIMEKEEITVRVDLNQGDFSTTVYTCDLSHEYIDINTNYRS